jgi:PAS domain-containing protein
LLSTVPAEYAQHMARLYDQSPLLVALFDPRDVVHYSNPAWGDAFGLRDQSGLTWVELMRHCHTMGVGTAIRTTDLEAGFDQPVRAGASCRIGILRGTWWMAAGST